MEENKKMKAKEPYQDALLYNAEEIALETEKEIKDSSGEMKMLKRELHILHYFADKIKDANEQAIQEEVCLYVKYCIDQVSELTAICKKVLLQEENVDAASAYEYLSVQLQKEQWLEYERTLSMLSDVVSILVDFQVNVSRRLLKKFLDDKEEVLFAREEKGNESNN